MFLTDSLSKHCAVLLVAALLFTLASSPIQAATTVTSRATKIFGDDDRTSVDDTTVFPYSATGMVLATFGDEVRTGTGAMIGKKLALTVAHLVYDAELGWADMVAFIPGKKGYLEPFGRVLALQTVSMSGWTSSADERYDMALLVLETAVGEQTGYFKIEVKPTAEFNDIAVNSLGYPSDLGGSTLYRADGTASEVEDNFIYFDIDCEPGQSGGPVWVGNGDAIRLVGVVKGNLEITNGWGDAEEWNIATHINQTFANWIEENLAQYDTITQGIASNTNVSGTACSMLGVGLIVAMLAGAQLCLTKRDDRHVAVWPRRPIL